MMTAIADQLETGMAFRHYKFGNSIQTMRDDERINKQLEDFGDPMLKLVYFQTLNILEKELGSDYPQRVRDAVNTS